MNDLIEQEPETELTFTQTDEGIEIEIATMGDLDALSDLLSDIGKE
jgi:hypothetical protein